MEDTKGNVVKEDDSLERIESQYRRNSENNGEISVGLTEISEKTAVPMK